MPSLFRRKSRDLVQDSVESVAEPATTDEAGPTERGRGYTPSKRERGMATPKRRDPHVRRTWEPPPTNRKEMVKRERERARAERAERRAGIAAGEDRYLLPRDKGPERTLVRDIVDSRMSLSTWFLPSAVLSMVGSSAMMPIPVRFAANLQMLLMLAGSVIDSVILSRRVKRMINQRFPKTELRLGGLYYYAITRAFMFRRIRMPKARVKVGTQV